MIQITPNFYEHIAQVLLDQLYGQGYFSGSFEFDFDSISCRMVLSAVVHYHANDPSVGYAGGVKDIVPVWWEFHTITDEGEQLNDFSLNELRQLIKLSL